MAGIMSAHAELTVSVPVKLCRHCRDPACFQIIVPVCRIDPFVCRIMPCLFIIIQPSRNAESAAKLFRQFRIQAENFDLFKYGIKDSDIVIFLVGNDTEDLVSPYFIGDIQGIEDRNDVFRSTGSFSILTKVRTQRMLPFSPVLL
jgi:hypothetical protein